MGGKNHALEENGVNRNDPSGEFAPLDSGADGGPLDDTAAVRPPDKSAGPHHSRRPAPPRAAP
jgi:hypothetical protein